MNRKPLLVAIAAAALLASGLAKAEYVGCRGKVCRVYQDDADRQIAASKASCSYGKPRFITLKSGTTVLATPKVCK